MQARVKISSAEWSNNKKEVLCSARSSYSYLLKFGSQFLGVQLVGTETRLSLYPFRLLKSFLN